MPDQADQLQRLNAALANRYRIERQLGRGGMATVYLAEDIKHERLVALKVLRPELVAVIGPERFLREITLTARLNHPHIVPLLDSGEADHILYYVMPYVEGESLRQKLNRETHLPIEDALQLSQQVASALDYAHRQGVVHRDIKPENILLHGGEAMVADFGIALALSAAGGERLTETGLSMGTPEYMSPEQASGAKQVDARSDIYSLGCVLYEMLAGEPPFTGPTPHAIIARKVSEPVPSLRVVRDAVAEPLEHVIWKALARVPADRYTTVQQLADDLTAERIAVALKRSKRRARIKRVLRPVAALAGIVALVLAGRAIARSNPGGPVTELSPNRIAVFPFEVQAGPERQYLGAGVMTLLASAIDGAGELRRVDPQALRSMVRRTGYDAVGPEEGREVATHFGAGRYLLGTVVAAGADVNISASLYDPEQGDIAAATVVVEGAEEDLSALVTSLAERLLEHPVMRMEARIGEISEIQTESYTALKAYLEGEALFWRGRYDSAVTAFERAVAEDSLFALAWFRLFGAYEWRSPGDPRGEDALGRAMALRERLSDKDRLHVEMRYRWLAGNREDAEALALQAVTQYPDEVESWYGLALLRDFLRWQDPRPLTEALDAYRRALELDPDHPQVLWNYTWALRRARQHALVDSLYRAAEEGGREIVFTHAHDAFMAVLFGDEATRDSTIDAMVHGFDELWALHSSGWAVQWLNTTSDSLELARRVVQSVFVDPPRPNSYRALGHWMSQALEVASGRWSSAVAHAAAAGRVDSSYASFGYVLLVMTPFLPLAQHELAAVRDSLLRIESWHARPWPEFEPPPEWDPIDVQPYMQPYLQGILSSRLGEYPQALDYAATLESLVQPSDSVGLANDLSSEIRALVAAEQGRTEEALALIERQGLRVPGVRQAGMVPQRPLGRLILAELLLQLGRHEEALAWFDSYPYLAGGLPILDLGYLSHNYGRMGEIYDALGNRGKAIEYYNRFVARWKNADPALQPRVEAARARLAELVAG